jgi:biopolymer transport protein ExbD
MSSHVRSSNDLEDDEEPLMSRRHKGDHAHFDITAMIDLVFMLNIFFMVTTVAAAMAEMDLPVVRHCIPTDPSTAVIVLLLSGNGTDPVVHLGDQPEGNGVTNPDEQIKRVRALVEEGMRSDKRVLLLKAERSVKLRDIQRIGAVVRDVPGAELRLAVIEKE